MDKLKLTGRNLGRVFKFRWGCLNAIQLYYFKTELPDIKLKTRPNQLLGSLPLDIALPGWFNVLFSVNCLNWPTCPSGKTFSPSFRRKSGASKISSRCTSTTILTCRYLDLAQICCIDTSFTEQNYITLNSVLSDDFLIWWQYLNTDALDI